jgi:hypothetical protein
MLEYRTQGYNGYSVKYSPFFDSRIAVAASANFGLVGNGRLYILGLTPNGIVAEKWYVRQSIHHHMRAALTTLKGSTPKTPSSTVHGQKRTKTRSLLRAVTAPLSSSISHFRNSPCNHGRNTHAKSSPYTGTSFLKKISCRVAGMAQSRSGTQIIAPA